MEYPVGNLRMLVCSGDTALKIGDVEVFPDMAISFDHRDLNEEGTFIQYPLMIMETVDEPTMDRDLRRLELYKTVPSIQEVALIYMRTCAPTIGIHVYRRKDGWERIEYGVDDDVPFPCMPGSPFVVKYPFPDDAPPVPEWYKNRPRPIEDPVHTFDGFQQFTEEHDRRYEFVFGKVQKMPNDTLRHAKIMRNLFGKLQVSDNDYKSQFWDVRIGNDILIPDVAVALDSDLADPAKAYYRTYHDDPQFVAEILATDDDFDLSKRQIYQQLPHLGEILLVSQTNQHAELFRRDPSTGTWPDTPIIFSNDDDASATITLTSLRGITFDLADLYKGTRLEHHDEAAPLAFISIVMPPPPPPPAPHYSGGTATGG